MRRISLRLGLALYVAIMASGVGTAATKLATTRHYKSIDKIKNVDGLMDIDSLAHIQEGIRP